MKFIFLLAILPTVTFAGEWASQMPAACEAELKKQAIIRDGSAMSESNDIINGLKNDWLSHPEHRLAVFDECGPYSYYYVIVDKEFCQVTKADFGSSGGICD